MPGQDEVRGNPNGELALWDEPNAELRRLRRRLLDTMKGVGCLRPQDGDYGSRNPLRRGSRLCAQKGMGVSLPGAAVGANLGGSSKYFSEDLED
ncbi:hypothetical protein WH47_10939 [Habropoda laboriosa]|uniref:Uncharacterized protein n=1 Tax=Habropoda laboriosa TaxID=597456 RepID=A0A0L7QKG1_9HYME|nr:hypothetical protein WH47_10939 [Habropoda laboriosa]